MVSIQFLQIKKTGTLTENKIEVSSLSFFDEVILVDKNKIDTSNTNTKPNISGLGNLLLISTLCNNAVAKGTGNHQKLLGEPIEIALRWQVSLDF